MEHKIGIIGYGNMGEALSTHLKEKYAIYVFDVEKNKTAGAQGVTVCAAITDLLKAAQTFILAVKPQDIDAVLGEIKDCLQDKLIICIAAGISTSHLEKKLKGSRVVRVMPNMPAKIAAGMTCLAKGRFAGDEDFSFAEKLFGYVGKTLRIDESLMNAATAVAGSAPGFFFESIIARKIETHDSAALKKFADTFFIPELTKAAEGLGFSVREAILLAGTTIEGSIKLLQETRQPPEKLLSQVASKGGTTLAGLAVLHASGSLADAVEAAAKRAFELSTRP